MTLVDLDTALAERGRYYPPVPTFTGAFVGGILATNAAGAATFKYGTTRDWARALTVVLANGDVLDIERGRTRAHEDGFFEIVLSDRTVRVPVPRYRMPDVPKVSAGYFAAAGMDLIDLFIGSEGTLASSRPPPRTAGTAGRMSRVRAVRRSRCGAGLRRHACAPRADMAHARPARMDRRSSADARCLALLRETAPIARASRSRRPTRAAAALELPALTSGGRSADQPRPRARRSRHAADRFCRASASRRPRPRRIAAGMRASAAIALRGGARRRERASAARNRRSRIAKKPRGRPIVPFERSQKLPSTERSRPPRRGSRDTSPTATCTRTSSRARWTMWNRARWRSRSSAAR